MPANAKTREKKKTERQSRREQPKREQKKRAEKGMSALDLLEQDHREVEELFDEFDELNDDSKKHQVAQTICKMLTVHAQIEEEIFYPEVRGATKDNDLIDEALVEHDSAKYLIEEIEDMEPGDDLFEARVRVLEDQIKRHVREEEEELFPEVTQSKLDLEEVGARLQQRKNELLEEYEEA
jgi:hemerythrin superfamily protein